MRKRPKRVGRSATVWRHTVVLICRGRPRARASLLAASTVSGLSSAICQKVTSTEARTGVLVIGFHPYFRLSDSPRDAWKVHVAARERVVKNFTWDHFRERLLEAYKLAMGMRR